ncbi:MAG: thiamine pyrophosphate-dependent enzyme [Candidatus Limnocylindrales bacterium]
MIPASTGGRAIVDALVAGGVRHAFTVPGESFLGVLDALRDAPIRTIATRHEAGAAFMAEGYGQLTGRPAVCLATRSVGAANLAIGLLTATADSTPLVAIVGQVPSGFRGREAFQEVDQTATFGRLCKAAVEVDDAARLMAETARLVALAQAGRPGPVLLAVPEDVVDAAAGGTHATPLDTGRPAAVMPAEAAVRQVLAELAHAASPVVVAGAGVLRSGAAELVGRFAERFCLPVVASWRRPDVMPNEHPFYIGMTGLAAPATVRPRLAAADVLLALGSRLNEITTFDYSVPLAGTQLIHVDAAPGFAGDRRPPDLAVTADTRAFLEAALALADPPLPDPAGHAARLAAVAADRAAYRAASTLPDAPPGQPIDPAVAVRALQAVLPEDAVVTTDAGNFAGWYARGLRFSAGQRFLGPTSGAMGYGLPAAIGAALAEPGRRVIALAGDGGLAMLMAELETAVREDARLTVLVHDNGMYGTIRMHQERSFPGRLAATDLGPIDFAAVARACGASASRVERDADVGDAIAEAVRGSGVTLVHLLTDPDRLSVDQARP